MVYRIYTNACKSKIPEDILWFSELYLKPRTQESTALPSYENYSPYTDYPSLRKPLAFYVVSDFFAKKLILQDALITDHFGFWIWGRETNPLIPLRQDSLINKIASEDSILCK
jgi:hypothetical protein